MGIKEISFIIFIIAIIIFPFSVSTKEVIIKNKINLPQITLENGKFKDYNLSLQKKGNFKYLSLYNYNYYIFDNIYIKFLNDNNASFISQKLTFNKKYFFINGKYITQTYTYIAKHGSYDKKSEKGIAYNFKFFNKSIDGNGQKMIYFNNKIYADNIKYIIKDIK